MIITIAFDVKNYVEVMEGWPIRIDDRTFFLEREGDVVKRVCISFSNVGIEQAATISKPSEQEGHPTISMGGSKQAALAIQYVLHWQAVIGGLQVFDIEFDDYEIRFRPESIEEEPHINLHSFRHSSKGALNAACDFEKIGRAFIVGPVNDARVEYSAHYRDGRLAFEAGRYVDAYNNMYLLLETLFCDGKTKTAQQVNLLEGSELFRDAFEQTLGELSQNSFPVPSQLPGVFSDDKDVREKIKDVVILRGKLRHHSLKSPHRWDPNKQKEYEQAARLISAVAQHIVLKESISDIYSPKAVKLFKDISISSGHETMINILCRRLEEAPQLALDMSFPTTVISSQVCVLGLRETISYCAKEDLLHETVTLEATHVKTKLEIFTAQLGTWAYTESRRILTDKPIKKFRCSFEHSRAGVIVQNEFYVPGSGNQVHILDAWKLLCFCLDWIDQKDPTTRVMSLKLFINDGAQPILKYGLGAKVRN